jgi:hypothetical protein
MTINGWIQKYDGKTLDLVGLHEMEWDLMGCAARITKTNEYVLRNGFNDFSSVSFQEMDLKLKGWLCESIELQERKDTHSNDRTSSKIQTIYSLCHHLF